MPGNSAKASSTALQKFLVPIRFTDRSVHDGAFTYMKERFAAEMRRVDEEMSRFSKNLLQLTGQTTTVHAGMTSSDRQSPATCWDVITKSPLLQGEGNDKVLHLQFDVSDYAPDEVSVEVLNNVLIVTAEHRENQEDGHAYSEFNREFLLPANTDPDAIESMLSNDGILTIKAPVRLETPDSISLSDEEN